MICTSQTQADRVAAAGAKKMSDQGYTWKGEVDFLPLANQNRFKIIKADGDRYIVNLHTHTCSCRFYAENAEFKACKHLEWMAQEKAETLEVEAAADRFNEEQAYRTDADAHTHYPEFGL